ncbi:MAG: hypothetical protein IPQ05_18315 [Leptospiraceae bacterium]|nr:hypothetical protein [Leptospiraceae bacterium]
MIKQSYLQSELSLLRKKYKKENIIHHGKGVIIKNMPIPKGFGSETGALFLEIPDGYGFGINIMNCYIMLDKKKEKFHLFDMGWENMPSDLAEHFSFDKKLTKSWYWICFHLSTETRGVYSSNKDRTKESDMVSATEFPHLIYIVLRAIRDGDPNMLARIGEMNERRKELQDEYRAMMARLTLELNWKKLSWMY